MNTFGNLVGNASLVRLVGEDSIRITPWEPDRAQFAHYPLEIEAVLIQDANGAWITEHDFRQKPYDFFLKANQYVVVELRQQIVLKVGYVGQFVPASNLIEEGLGITAGKISFPFGQKNEKIRFGLKNLLDRPNDLGADKLVGYVQFFYLPESEIRKYSLSKRDEKVYQRRRRIADDDSVWALQNTPDAPI